MANKRSKKIGSPRMIELGYKPMQLWLSPEDHEKLKSAAKKARLPMTRFVITIAMEEAEVILTAEGNGKPPKKTKDKK